MNIINRLLHFEVKHIRSHK